MYKEESITFDSGWKRIKLEFIDKIESNLESYDLNDKDARLIKLKPNEYITYYKLVYDMCTQKDSNYSEMLYNHLGQSLIEFIKTKMCNNLQPFKDNDGELVELIYQYWTKYKSYINTLRGIFSYLDRFYVQLALQPTIYEYAMAIFQKHIFEPYKLNLRRYLLDSLDTKRRGEEINNSHVSAIIEMYNKLDSTLGLQYKEYLEPFIIERCSDYYNKISSIWLNDLSLLDYMYIIQYCIDDELEYCNKYLNKNTNESIYNTILASLLYNQQDKINGKFNELKELFETYQDLKLIYKLTNKLNNINERVSNSLSEFIVSKMKENDIEHMVKLYNKYLNLIRFSFNNNNYILNVYNSKFKNYVNNLEFINHLLSYFHEYIISQGSESLEDETRVEEPDGNINDDSNIGDLNSNDELDEYVNVYNLLADKNEFLNSYKMNLCYRLMNGKTSVEREARVLNKLSHDEPNIGHLHKILDDVKKSNDLYEKYVSRSSVDDMDHYKNHSLSPVDEDRGVHSPKQDRIIAICNTYWPALKTGYEGVLLNKLFLNSLNQFQEYYTRNNKFKRFEYLYEYSPVEIVYEYTDSSDTTLTNGKLIQKQITCNLLQATLILMFNNVEAVKAVQALSEMNIKHEQLVRIVESCQAFFIFENDELSINYEYVLGASEVNLLNNIYKPLLSTKSYGTVKHRETLLENYNCIDSVIVKIMKKYKKLSQNELVNIVNTNLSSLHINVNYNEQIILDRIKNLIHKEYIEHLEDQLQYIP